jgi:hypothetical protein
MKDLLTYARLFLHYEKLKAFEKRLQRLIADEQRYEGRVDPEDKQDLESVTADIITIRRALDVAKYTNDANVNQWQPKIKEVTSKLRFPVGTV